MVTGGNKMRDMRVPVLLLNMGAPMMVSMLVQALYNVVDTFFVSYIPDAGGIANMGDRAITALTLAFPVQLLITALSVGTGVGICTMVSRYLGSGDAENAERTAGNGLTIALIYYIIMLVFGIFGSSAFIRSQTSDPVTASLGTTYLRIVTVFSLGAFLHIAFEKIVQASGRTTVTMMCQMSGALTNIILDPIFIFALRMGVAGAAVATVIGQFVSCAVIILFFIFRGVGVKIRIRNFRPRSECIKRIYSVGLPSIFLQMLTSVMSYAMNIILGTVSYSCVTAYGVYSKLQNFIFMPGYGLNNASIPIISYNYGAGESKRVSGTIKWALLYVTVIMVLGTLFLQAFAPGIVSLFSMSGESFSLAVRAIRIITLGFIFAGCNIIFQGICSALGKGTYSLFIAMARSVIVAVPVAYLISLTPYAVSLVWVAIPAAEVAACVSGAVLTYARWRKCNES